MVGTGNCIGLFFLLRHIAIEREYRDRLPGLVPMELLSYINQILVPFAVDLPELSRPASPMPQFLDGRFPLLAIEIKNPVDRTTGNLLRSPAVKLLGKVIPIQNPILHVMNDDCIRQGGQ